MKLSQIKSVFIGFIIATISIFLFNDNVKAYEIQYNGVTFDLDDIQSQIMEYFDTTIDFENTYKYHAVYINHLGELVFASSEGGYFEQIDTSLPTSTDYIRNDNYRMSLSFGSSGFIFGTKGYGYIYNFSTGKSYYKNSSGSTATVISGGSSGSTSGRFIILTTSEYQDLNGVEDYTNALKQKILYANVNISANYDNAIRPYDYLPLIQMSKVFANDLDGNEVYIVKTDFANIYDDTYTYQIKTDYLDWFDITSTINEMAQNEAYTYEYVTYHNTTVYARVLDSNGEVLDETSINVNELNNFDMIVSHGEACDEQGRNVNVITVNLLNCWNNDYTYQYSYDNETFYNMNVDESNKIFNLSHGVQTFLYFRILDKNGSVIYTKDYEEIFSGLDTKVILEVNPYTNAETQDKTIEITVDFSLYSRFKDLYPNMRFYINGELITSDIKTYVLTKENYADFQEIDVNVYIDNFWVEGWCYSPHYGDMGDTEDFDDKYEDILLDKLEDELNNGDFSSSEGWYKSIETFINAISDIVTKIFDLIMGFFNRLNAWIRVLVISLFIVLVVTRVIKVVRK